MRITRMVVPGLLVMLLSLPAWLATAQQEQASTPEGQQIIQQEQSMWQALKNKDRAALDAMTGSTAMFVTDKGTQNKWDFLNSLPQLNLQTNSLSNIQVRMPGGDSRIVTYQLHQSGTMAGQPLPATAWVTSVWYNQNGKWLLVSHQVTPTS